MQLHNSRKVSTVPTLLLAAKPQTCGPPTTPLRIAFLSGYNSRDEGSNVSANRTEPPENLSERAPVNSNNLALAADNRLVGSSSPPRPTTQKLSVCFAWYFSRFAALVRRVMNSRRLMGSTPLAENRLSKRLIRSSSQSYAPQQQARIQPSVSWIATSSTAMLLVGMSDSAVVSVI